MSKRNKGSFSVKVLANRLDWESLPDKLKAVRQFYSPACDLQFDVVHTALAPVFNSTYPDLAPVAIVDKGWYAANIAEPHAADADIVVFIVSPSDHGGTITYLGSMNMHNFGPWEITVFAGGEDDVVLLNGSNYGNEFVLTLEHELSHAFYNYIGKRDDTHQHFPAPGGNPYPFPSDSLADFDFSSRYAILEWLKEKCLQMLAMISLIRRRSIAQETSLATRRTFTKEHLYAPRCESGWLSQFFDI